MGENTMKSPEKKEHERCQEYCDGNIAIFYCPQCLTNYCADCYDKEHKLKRRKENHDKVSAPRKVCQEHHLTLEYQNKSRYMCCMCVKELPPGELARNNIEPIDGVATVFKEKLEERIRELEMVSQAINKKIEASNENISSAVECARSEVRRFFTALNLLLNKQEESFQHQLTCLLHTTTSKAVFSEMKQTLGTTEDLVKEGKALLCGDNLIVAEKFDHISREIDELLDSESIKKFPSPTLNVSINVHRHLLEMVRHPGYISTTFDESRESGNIICKSEMKTEKLDETKMKEKEDIRETFPTPPQISICSPPMSVAGEDEDEDEDTPYSLMPQYSRNSSPFLLSADEGSTLRPFAVNNVNEKDLDKGTTRSSLCSCSEQSLNTMTEMRQVSQQTNSEQDVHQATDGNDDFRSKCKENKENKNGKRKNIQNSFYLPFARKSRRTEASKELNQCDKILTELWVSDDSFPFAKPVDHKKVPEYYEVIKNPTDLTAIKTKLQTISYDSVYDFVDDMKLLFDNCYLFNPTSSVTFESGVKLEKQFMRLMRESFPSLYYQSSIPENNVSQEKTT